MKRVERYLLIALLGFFSSVHADELGDDQYVEQFFAAEEQLVDTDSGTMTDKNAKKDAKKRKKEEARQEKELQRISEQAEKETREKQERLEIEQAKTLKKEEKERKKEEARHEKELQKAREQAEKEARKEQEQVEKKQEKEAQERAKEEARREKELQKAREQAEKEAQKEQERLEKEHEKEVLEQAKEDARREKELQKAREQAEKEVRKEQERLEKDHKKEAHEQAKEEARREKELQKVREQAEKEARTEQERLEKEREKEARERAQEEKAQKHAEHQEMLRMEQERVKTQVREELAMKHAKKIEEQEAHREQVRQEKEQQAAEKKREHEKVQEEMRLKRQEQAERHHAKQAELKKAQEAQKLEVEAREEQARLDKEAKRRAVEREKADRQRWAQLEQERVQREILDKSEMLKNNTTEFADKNERATRKQAERALKKEEQLTQKQEHKEKHKSKKIKEKEDAEYQRLIRQQNKLQRVQDDLMLERKRREALEDKTKAGRERLDRKSERALKLRNEMIEDGDQWQAEIEQEKELRRERLAAEKETKYIPRRRREEQKEKEREQAREQVREKKVRRQEEAEHSRLLRQQRKMKQQEEARQLAMKRQEIAKMKTNIHQEKLNTKMDKIRMERREKQEKMDEWRDYRTLEVDLDRSTGAFADLAMSPSWPFYMSYFPEKSYFTVAGNYSYAVGAYGSHGHPGGIHRLVVGDGPVRLRDISLASCLLNQNILTVLTTQINACPPPPPNCPNPVNPVKICVSDKVGLGLQNLANNCLSFKGREDKFGLSFDISHKVFWREFVLGMQLPIVYNHHRLQASIQTKDVAGVDAGSDELIAPIVLTNLLRAKGITELGGSAGGLGDITLFAHLEMNSPKFEKLVTGLRVLVPTAKKASTCKLWGPEIGNGGFTEVTLFGALQCYYKSYLNPYVVLEATYKASARVNRRVPKLISRGALDAQKPVGDLIALGNHAQTNLAISSYDTSIPALADNVLRLKIKPGAEVRFKMGSMFEKFILRRAFLDIFYDVYATAHDHVGNAPCTSPGVWNTKALEDRTNHVAHKIGTEYSYQCDADTRLRLGVQYTVAGKNVPQALEFSSALNYSF